MIRKLIDSKKLDNELGNLLITSYPHGYGDEDIVRFKNANGDFIEAVELKTEDTIYMVKISKSLSTFIANFEDSIVKELPPKKVAGDVPFEDLQQAMQLNFAFRKDEER